MDVESICRVGPHSDVPTEQRGLVAAGADQLPRSGLRDRQPEFNYHDAWPESLRALCATQMVYEGRIGFV